MKLFVCPNQSTPRQIDAARRSIQALERGLKAQCALAADDSRVVFGDAAHAAFSPRESDFIVSIGGDGAVLRAAQAALAADRPLLGINGGRLGYLCALDLADVETLSAERLARWPISPRTLLAFEFGGRERLALNDVVIAKRSFGTTVELTAELTGAPAMKLRGDGVIIATPTGSTAYNLSAGGPILMPDAGCFALTPICAHASQQRARVFSDSASVTLSAARPDVDDACVYADGIALGALDQPLTVRRAEKTLRLLAPRPVAGLT
ncbi:MAG: NAD(+)/NADH kinase [Clostridia bacterium]|nr:NAD(+)/NADH kinase [Clostridia bacterium]